MKLHRRRVSGPGAAALLGGVLLLILIAFHNQILFAFGSVLTSAGPPVRSDMIIVLGGDYLGNRMLTGAELVRKGYAPALLASGSAEMYGHFESDLAIHFAEEHGYPRGFFYPVHHGAMSTRDEARVDIAELRRRGARSIVVVTSAFHTARAGRIFRREARDLQVHMVAAPDPYWNGGRWWTSREGQKEWFFETCKTFADFAGL